MSTLARAEILAAMRRPLPNRLVVTPLLDPLRQVADCAVDLRLGNEFITMRRTAFAAIDLRDRTQTRDRIEAYQSRTRIGFQENFVLHPHQLVLAAAWEYVSIPADLCGYVIGRSSWGRLGLIIATATFVNPGYKGCLTLELVNLGDVPLILYPGIRIAQLILHTVEGQGEYKGRYRTPIAPEFSKIHDDEELDLWCAEHKTIPEREFI